ncbi:MAG: nuclear transport factor 2 family protein [Planctomycetes bacterium]|nr:nuclear transport factor 2 family protein [Planctomycetota bacterium]
MKPSNAMLSRSLAALLLGAGIVTAAALAAQPEQPAVPAQTQPASKPINKLCPIMENEVDADAPTRQFKGVTIGFCCPGCDRKWDRKSDEAKMALLTKAAPEAVAAINALNSPALKIAREYLAACGRADVAALDALFLDKGRATVIENAGDEGTWETYRDHHLMPELKEMPGFAVTMTKEDVQTFGATSIVRQIGSFTVPDTNHPDAPRTFKAAVTYVVVDEGGTPKIAHLHWSSRAEKKPDAAAPAARNAGHGSTPGHEHK